MKVLLCLLKKDFRNLRLSLGPALFFCLPLLLFLSVGSEFSERPHELANLSFWISYFIALSSLFYRSFSLENRFQSFHIYTALRVPKISIFVSQSLVNFLGAVLIGVCYLSIVQIFWAHSDFDFLNFFPLILVISLALSPLGSLLSLLLQIEREFLFSLFFLPVSTPLFLGALSISHQSEAPWFWVMSIFALISIFLSALLFEFFFDELTQSY